MDTRAINHKHETDAASRNAFQARYPYEAAFPLWVTWGKHPAYLAIVAKNGQIYRPARIVILARKCIWRDNGQVRRPSAFSSGRENAFGAKMAKYTAVNAFSLRPEMHLAPPIAFPCFARKRICRHNRIFILVCKCMWRPKRISIFGT